MNPAKYRQCGVALLLMLVLNGCRDPRRLPSPPVVEITKPVNESDPATVAREFLDISRVMLDVGQIGMRDPAVQVRFEAAKEQLDRLADRDGIMSHYPYATHSADAQQRKLNWSYLTSGNWPSLVAHYINGVRLDTLVVVETASFRDRSRIASQADRVATVLAENPADAAERAEIERRAAEARDVRGQPLKVGSAEYEDYLRHEAVAHGISPSPGVNILIAMRRVAGEWRICSVTVEPMPMMAAGSVTASRPVGAAADSPSRDVGLAAGSGN